MYMPSQCLTLKMAGEGFGIAVINTDLFKCVTEFET